MIKLTPEQKEEIKTKILDGKQNYSDIAKEYNVCSTTISNYAAKLGVSRRIIGGNPILWNAAKIDKFMCDKNSTIRRVSQNIRNVKVELEWQCSLCMYSWKQTFDSLRKKSPYGCDACGKNKYSVYHAFLDTINPLSAYFMGVYFAHGSTTFTNTKNFSTLRITSVDKEKLERLSELIFSTYPVKPQKSEGGYRIDIKSKRFYDKLLEYNALSKNGIPKSIPPEFIPHFVRGYVDFTGYFEEHLEIKCSSAHRFNISGDIDFIKQVQTHYIKHNQKKGKTQTGYLQVRKEKNPKIAELHIAGSYNPYYFMEWLYNSEIIPLKYVSGSRYNTFLFLKHEIRQKEEMKKYITSERDRFLYLRKKRHESFTFTKIAKKYGVSFRQVKKISIKVRPKVTWKIQQKIKKDIKENNNLLAEMEEIITRVHEKTGMKPDTFKRSHYNFLES